VDKGRKPVNEWGFDGSRRERTLLLVWSDQSTQEAAKDDGTSYRCEVPSSLAPLMLAWGGQPNEDCRSFVLTLHPSRTNRAARLRLEFDAALPLPPESWPW